jgi:hypothetical protein
MDEMGAVMYSSIDDLQILMTMWMIGRSGGKIIKLVYRSNDISG